MKSFDRDVKRIAARKQNFHNEISKCKKGDKPWKRGSIKDLTTEERYHSSRYR